MSFLLALVTGPAVAPPVLTRSCSMWRQGRVTASITAGELPCLAAVRKRRTTVRSLASQQESFWRSRAASSVTSCLVGASSWGPPAREEERREKSSELRCWVASGLFLVSRQISA